MPVIVEWAASHTAAVDFQPIVLGSLLHADRRLDVFIDCHRKTSVHNSLESTNTRRDWQVLRLFYYGYDGFEKKQAKSRTTSFQKTGQLI